jgi:diguanylate cyclase (GGDEF)-like protein
VFLDVDCLKQINDTYGHMAGDAVLKGLSRLIGGTIRTIDVLCRYGGDEFCIIMPEIDQHHCRQFLQRLSETIENRRLGPPGISEQVCCTVSMGAAIFPDHADDPRGLLAAADSALLESKEAGRNTFRIHHPVSASGPGRNS